MTIKIKILIQSCQPKKAKKKKEERTHPPPKKKQYKEQILRQSKKKGGGQVGRGILCTTKQWGGSAPLVFMFQGKERET